MYHYHYYHNLEEEGVYETNERKLNMVPEFWNLIYAVFHSLEGINTVIIQHKLKHNRSELLSDWTLLSKCHLIGPIKIFVV